MTDLQVILPMAGLGSRFARAGFALPKPLIPVDGTPMFQKALSSLDGLGDRRIATVVQRDHVERFDLERLIRDADPDAHVEILPEVTRGAAESALAAAHWLEPAAPLVVMDCDLWFSSDSYEREVRDGDADGALLTFVSDDPRYSYARIEDDLVVETAEKRVISDRAVTGAYFFRRAGLFVDAAERLVAAPLETEPEYYMSSVFEVLLGEGRRIGWASVDRFASFGTPEELARHESRDPGR